MDIFEKIKGNRGPLGQHANIAHGYFAFPKLEGEIGPHMRFRGKEVLNWSLNDYLGFANHPLVRKADADATQSYGLAYPMGARMMSGNSNNLEQFEAEISDFMGKEDTMVVNYGYQGMVSLIDALLDRKDVVVYDSECHACIIDGLRMHIGKRFVFAHNNMEGCEKQLQRATKMAESTGGGILLITEGVFGMLGDMGNLTEIVKLKEKYSFRLLVDDAHGFGVMGAKGRGAAEAMGVLDEVDIYFSTFAKSMASIGGFVSSKEDVIQYLRYNTRSQIFAKTLPMPIVVGNRQRLKMLREEPEHREKLWTIVHALQKKLRERGFNIGQTTTPVTPVFLSGGNNEAANLIIDLRENYHIFCSVVIYPVVPKGVIMLRLIPTAAHTLEDVERTIQAFESISDKLKSGHYASSEINIMQAQRLK